MKSDPAIPLSEFDFRQPAKLNRGLARHLQLLHETFAASVSQTLSSMIGRGCSLTSDGVREGVYGTYISRVETPSQLTIVEIEPLPGFCMVEIPAWASISLVEVMLGARSPSVLGHRSLTDLEENLMRRVVVQPMLEALAAAFEPVMDLVPQHRGTESNPEFAQIVGRGETVITASFELSVAGFEPCGVSICYPFPTIHPLLSKISLGSPVAPSGADGHTESRTLMEALISDVEVEVAVSFSPLTMSGNDLLGLSEGDVVRLDHGTSDPLIASVDGLRLLEVEPVKRGRKSAARVVAAADTPRPTTGAEAR